MTTVERRSEADIEANKQTVHARHEAVQRLCLGGGAALGEHMAAQQRHVLAASMPDNPASGPMWLKHWHAETVSPTFHCYGPMIAQRDYVVEEWETFIHGADGALYNNHYCWLQRIENGQVVEVREYVDSHHVWTICGRTPPWPALEPLTARRPAPLDGVEITSEFDLDPALLRDPVPSGASVAPGVSSGPEANAAVIADLHAAQAAGDLDRVDALYAEGFSYYLAGEHPFGWDHLPLEDIYAPLAAHLTSPLRVRFGPVVAEGDYVVVEMDAHGTLDDGTVYQNFHCFVHEVRDGLITRTREYLDTHHVWVTLGRWADWAATPVPPLRNARRSNLPEVVACYQHRNPFLDLERWGGAMI